MLDKQVTTATLASLPFMHWGWERRLGGGLGGFFLSSGGGKGWYWGGRGEAGVALPPRTHFRLTTPQADEDGRKGGGAKVLLWYRWGRGSRKEGKVYASTA